MALLKCWYRSCNFCDETSIFSNQTNIGKQIIAAFTSVLIGGIISVANRIHIFDSIRWKESSVQHRIGCFAFEIALTQWHSFSGHIFCGVVCSELERKVIRTLLASSEASCVIFCWAKDTGRGNRKCLRNYSKNPGDWEPFLEGSRVYMGNSKFRLGGWIVGGCYNGSQTKKVWKAIV